MTSRHLRAGWAALLAVLVAACSTSPTPSGPPSTPTGPSAPSAATGPSAPTGSPSGDARPDSVDCAHDIGGRPPDDNFRLVLDSVALPTRVLEAHDSGEPGRLFAKTGLLVRADRAIEMTVTTPGVTLGWGSPGPEGTTIRVPPCPSPQGWLAFAGGYEVTAPTCVALTVRAGGREQQAEVSVGAEC
ncbi:hypothetical protein M1L60_11050 [Actinoplanes sp. TRM 88003]|uniref:Lipoprotein n=1 Tax=Paractinoplanes aksuensis TaxID=2939490 RepID=A0ABT1DJY5_9ACTN|nr:hypothetical protein [Actinoplanes aksuensis]MCO8271130.1 hypothetical protein [Actinoplanes aksuensis]